MMLHGTTISRNIVELLDLPELILSWDVTAQINEAGEIDAMPLRVVLEQTPTEVTNYALSLVQHVWKKVYEFQQETKWGKNEAINNLEPLTARGM